MTSNNINMEIKVSAAIKIGITGGIGCGKTTVGEIFEREQIAVLDADDLVHSLLMKGQPVYTEVVKEFGSCILGEGAEIDRSILAEIVFNDETRLEQLNGIVHPHVRQYWREWLAAREKDNQHAAVIIPLLFEIGEVDIWDATVCVAASPEYVESRLIKRGLGQDQIRKRMRAQMPLGDKMALADYVILNDGSVNDLENRTKTVLKTILTTGDRAL